MSKLLAPLILSAFLYGCPPSNSNSSCGTDLDCPGNQLCISNVCQSSCGTDQDCPGTKVCNSGFCQEPVSYSPRTHQQTWDGFREALSNNNLEQAVQYFSPHIQETYRTELGQKNLTAFGSTLPDLPSPSSSDDFHQYELTIDGEDFALILTCQKIINSQDDYCFINQF